MKASGMLRLANEMVGVFKYGQTALGMKDTGKETRQMEEEG